MCVSELAHRNRFSTFEGDITGIGVLLLSLEAYPFASRGQLVGVFEVHQDVTTTFCARQIGVMTTRGRRHTSAGEPQYRGS